MMTAEDLKKEIARRKEEARLRKMSEKIFKDSRRSLVYLGAITLAVISGCVGLAVFKNQVEKRVAIRAEKDKVTDMTLIAMERNVTAHGYVGLMFFSHADQTNRADAIMSYAASDPNVIENVRHLKLGEKKKVSEWKGLVTQKYNKGYSWHELTK